MKPRHLLPIVILLTVVGTTAQAALTRLVVSSFDNAPIMVYVNDVQYGPFSNRHKIQNLAPGVHNLRVVALYNHPYHTYNVQEQVYFGPVNIPNGHEVITQVRRNGTLAVLQMTAMLPPVPRPQPVGFCGTGIVRRPPIVTNPVYNPVVPAGPIAMDHFQFADVMQVIRNQHFDNSRRNVARQIISQHWFTSAQIAQMLQLFSFDSSRLEVAKFAYTHVVDPNRYYMTFDAFTFSSSVNELTRYMNSVNI